MQTLSPQELPWLDSPGFPELLARSSLDARTKSLVQHYADYGYVVIDLEMPEFDRCSQEIIQGLATEYRGQSRIQDAWLFNHAVRAIAIQPQILALLEVFYQRRPIPFQTLNFPVGTQQRTHSDTIHFHSLPERYMCGVWVALEDIDLYNGPLHYYPGSHKLPIVEFPNIGLTPGYANYGKYEDYIQFLILERGLERVDLSVRKGQALIWSANLLHGGSPILDHTRTRHSQVTHYFFSDCLYYKPMLSTSDQKYLYEVVDIATRQLAQQTYQGQSIGYRDPRSWRTLLSKKLRLSHPLLAKQLHRLSTLKQRFS
jgi:hypothetical protein